MSHRPLSSGNMVYLGPLTSVTSGYAATTNSMLHQLGTVECSIHWHSFEPLPPSACVVLSTFISSLCSRPSPSSWQLFVSLR